MLRIGQSTDIHKLVNNRDLIIGGVKIPSELGLLGHSDADVLVHAIAESILGALALGDLGKTFPDNDDQYKGISSLKILEVVYQMMKKQAYHINNLDALVIIEKPKMAPYIKNMRENIAEILNTNINNVNIKATRGEGLGFVGSLEGAIGQAVVLLESD